MFDKLKQQPLLGLALAIAGGYILAHIVTRALDITYKDALESDPASAAAWLFVIALVASIIWNRRSISAWFRSIRRKPSPHKDPQFAAKYPRTVAWASEGDNATVAGVDGLYELAEIEQNAAVMRAAERASPYMFLRKLFRRREHERSKMPSIKENTLSPTARLTLDFMKADAEAALGRPHPHSEPEPGTEARYFQDIDDVIRTMGDKGSLTIYAQINPDFLKASLEVCEVGFECSAPERLVASSIADAAVGYLSDKNLGLRLLELSRDLIPKLLPQEEPAAAQKK